MALIIDKDALVGINDLTDESMHILNELVKDETDSVHLRVEKDYLMRLISGYLYFYNKSIEHSIMPSPAKQFIYKSKIH